MRKNISKNMKIKNTKIKKIAAGIALSAITSVMLLTGNIADVCNIVNVYAANETAAGNSAVSAGSENNQTDYTGYTEISTVEELQAVSKNLSGKYVLKNDIDAAGIDWKPLDFTGIFDGNGYSILNLTVTSLNSTTAVSYDGNYKTYDTYSAGMFGLLSNATVTNLSLVNEKVNVSTDKPAFIGGIAGFSDNSQISNCNISGNLELTANTKMFGVGGIVGYGNGSIDYTNADVTLICTDTNREERDEQFMGGAYAAGYMNLGHCNVKIAGYDSDHGYVHDGGLVGMYILYPAGNTYAGYITYNNVTGKITFFEDNTDRRAYCVAFIGEIMNWTFTNGWNTQDFVRDERYDYDVNLRPDMCENPHYTATVTESTCDTYGYTTYTCDTCGYSYTDNYKLHSHNVTDWKVVKEATTDAEGLRVGTCSLCGKEVTETIPVLTATVAQTNEETKASETKKETSYNMIGIIVVVLIVVLVIAVSLILYAQAVKKSRKKRRRKRSKR